MDPDNPRFPQGFLSVHQTNWELNFTPDVIIPSRHTFLIKKCIAHHGALSFVHPFHGKSAIVKSYLQPMVVLIGGRRLFYLLLLEA